MHPTADTLPLIFDNLAGRRVMPAFGGFTRVAMRVIEFSREHARPIELFGSVSTSSVPLGDGSGEAHVYCLYFEAGGVIGEHLAGFGQLFLLVAGAGWAAGGDGRRVPLAAGQGVYFERGELHSKGSEVGMTVIMVQTAELRQGAPGSA